MKQCLEFMYKLSNVLGIALVQPQKQKLGGVEFRQCLLSVQKKIIYLKYFIEFS